MTVFVLFAVYLSLGNYNLNRITLRCFVVKGSFLKNLIEKIRALDSFMPTMSC